MTSLRDLLAAAIHERNMGRAWPRCVHYPGEPQCRTEAGRILATPSGQALLARVKPDDCTHYCQTGHFDGDDMVMNELRGWELRDRGLELDGVTPIARVAEADARHHDLTALVVLLADDIEDVRDSESVSDEDWALIDTDVAAARAALGVTQ